MDRLCVVADSDIGVRYLRAGLAGIFDAHFVRLDRIPGAAPEGHILVDINLRTPGPWHELRSWLRRRPRGAQAIFAVHRDSRAEAVQAHALGASGLMARPVTGKSLHARLAGTRRTAEVADGFETEGLAGIGAGVTALCNMFDAVLKGEPIDPGTVIAASDVVVSTIDEDGLTRWIDVVRRHHGQTYQHCLLVTGIAVGFARSLGFGRVDRLRLASAGLVHDVGKARIPRQILEKPGPLDDAESAIMRDHPLLGVEVLQSAPGLQPEMIDMVAHHHEYLDGSGYPHGLAGNSISDLVRTITICDIYGALIERRSYRPPLAPAEAYDLLLRMGGKLDKDLVREFRTIARV